MPATPRVAAIGLTTAVALVLGVPLIAGFIATHYVSIQRERIAIHDDLGRMYDIIRDAGLETDRLPVGSDASIDLSSTQPRIVCITGQYAVCEDDFPLHRLPRNVVAFVQSRASNSDSSVSVSSCDSREPLSTVFGRSKGVGIGVVFADGHVKMLKDATPLSVLRPFLTRNTAVQNDRDKALKTYELPL